MTAHSQRVCRDGCPVSSAQRPGRRGRAAAHHHLHRHRDAFVVEPGMRIAQLVILPIPELELVEVDELPESERGVRGFGSSQH